MHHGADHGHEIHHGNDDHGHLPHHTDHEHGQLAHPTDHDNGHLAHHAAQPSHGTHPPGHPLHTTTTTHHPAGHPLHPSIHPDHSGQKVERSVVFAIKPVAKVNKDKDKHDSESSTRKEALKKKHVGNDDIDLSGPHGKRVFCRNLNASLYPLSIILSTVGRFPLGSKHLLDGTFEYHSNCASMSVLHFNVTTFVFIYAFSAGMYNVISILQDVPPLVVPSALNLEKFHTERRYDKALIQRHAIPLIIVFATILQGLLSSLFFTQKHQYLAHIFSFMNKAAYTLHMDLAGKVTDFSMQSTVIYTAVTCILIMSACFKFGPMSIGMPTVFGSLMLRLLLGSRVWMEDERMLKMVQVVGGIFLVTIYTASISPMLLFIYKCKIVKNAFACWNGRAYCALLRGLEHAQTEEARTTYNLLFKDHCVLLDLVDSIDEMYSLTVESFFALQVLSFFFQMYFFVKSGSQGHGFIPEDDLFSGNNTSNRIYTYVRPYDWIPALVILLTTAILLVSVGRAAAKVAEEAEAGFEILRRKGMIGRKTDQELEFAFSMYYSFHSYRKIEISGAGYLYYNKMFLIQLFAVSLFCFMLLIQFHPILDYQHSVAENITIAKFIRKIEGGVQDSDDWNWMDGHLWKFVDP